MKYDKNKHAFERTNTKQGEFYGQKYWVSANNTSNLTSDEVRFLVEMETKNVKTFFDAVSKLDCYSELELTEMAKKEGFSVEKRIIDNSPYAPDEITIFSKDGKEIHINHYEDEILFSDFSEVYDDIDDDDDDDDDY